MRHRCLTLSPKNGRPLSLAHKPSALFPSLPSTRRRQRRTTDDEEGEGSAMPPKRKEKAAPRAPPTRSALAAVTVSSSLNCSPSSHHQARHQAPLGEPSLSLSP